MASMISRVTDVFETSRLSVQNVVEMRSLVIRRQG